MDCRTTSSLKFKAILGFKQEDIILIKRQSVLTKIMSSFEANNIQTQYNVLINRIYLYFYGDKFAIEIDKNEHSNKNINYEIKRQKEIEKELDCNFIRVNCDKEGFDIFRTINELFRHIKQLTE